jgi:hypothetical protein
MRYNICNVEEYIDIFFVTFKYMTINVTNPMEPSPS